MFSREASANISRSGSLRSSIKRSRACSHALLDRAIVVTAKRAYTKGQATSSSVFTMDVAHQAADCAIHARTNSVGFPTACARLRAQRDGMYTDSLIPLLYSRRICEDDSIWTSCKTFRSYGGEVF